MNKKLEEAGKILGSALNGDHRARGIIKALVEGEIVTGLSEAISTSDLARTFAFANASKVRKQYAKLPTTWTQFAKREIFEDFKPKRQREFLFTDTVDLDTNGGIATAPESLPNIPELTEYPAFRFTTSEKGLAIAKKGARVPFSWEAVINDEWQFIASLPGELAKFAKNTEELEAVRGLASATGPSTATFSGVSAPRNWVLSLDALSAAKTEIRARKVNGRYITVNRFALVVPTTLKDEAERILNLTSLQIVDKTNPDREVRYQTATGNSDITLVVNDWLTKVDQSANAANTWYLVPLGGSDGTRDSLIVGFLRNHEQPEFRQSGNTGQYLGGGTVPALEGSLLNDDIEYRVRHVVSGGVWYTDALFASTGEVAAPARNVEV